MACPRETKDHPMNDLSLTNVRHASTTALWQVLAGYAHRLDRLDMMTPDAAAYLERQREHLIPAVAAELADRCGVDLVGA